MGIIWVQGSNKEMRPPDFERRASLDRSEARALAEGVCAAHGRAFASVFPSGNGSGRQDSATSVIRHAVIKEIHARWPTAAIAQIAAALHIHRTSVSFALGMHARKPSTMGVG